MQAYSVRVYGGACIVCCLCTVVRNVYGMFNNFLRNLWDRGLLEKCNPSMRYLYSVLVLNIKHYSCTYRKMNNELL